MAGARYRAVDNLCRVDQVLRLLGLEVRRVVAVRGGEVCDERALAALHKDGARAGRLLRLLHVVHDHAVRARALLELFTERVLADAPDERGPALAAVHPLRHADRVLGGATGDILHRVRRGEFGVPACPRAASRREGRAVRRSACM